VAGREGLGGCFFSRCDLRRSCGPFSNRAVGEQEDRILIDLVDLPDAGKKQKKRKRRRSVRSFLLNPRTWKAAITLLGFALRLVRLVAKIGELFG